MRARAAAAGLAAARLSRLPAMRAPIAAASAAGHVFPARPASSIDAGRGHLKGYRAEAYRRPRKKGTSNSPNPAWANSSNSWSGPSWNHGKAVRPRIWKLTR